MLVEEGEVELCELVELVFVDGLMECFGYQASQPNYFLSYYLPIFNLYLITLIIIDTNSAIIALFLIIDKCLCIYNRIDIFVPVALPILTIHLQYLCYFIRVVVLAFEHVKAVCAQQTRINLHDVLVIGLCEYGVLVDWTEREVVFGPAFDL